MSFTTTSSPSSKKKNETKNKNKNINNLLTVLSLPKKWQDFESKKDDTYRIDPRRIFGGEDGNNDNNKYKQYAIINNNNNNDGNDNDMKNDDDDDTSTLAPAPASTPTPTPTSWSYDTIIDMKKYDSNDLIVSFDLDLYMEENHKKIEQEEEVEEEEKKMMKKKKKQLHHVHVHLNRDATENADRAYKRLEISIMKKITTLKSKSKKNKSRKKQQKINYDGRSSSSLCTTRLFTSTTSTTSTTTTITTTKNDTTTTAIASTNNTITTNINRRPIHIDELSTVELSKKIESLLLHCNSQEQEDSTTTTTNTTTTTSSSSVGLELSIPSLSDDAVADAGADADADKKGRSNNDNDGTHHKDNNMKLSPNSNNNNNNNITNFQFNVLSNPPVILATHMFESFQSKLFVGIPIVIQTTLLHATRAEVSWFVGKSNNNGSGHKYDNNIGTNKEEEDKGEEEQEEFELVLHDSHSFVPQSHHIGKTLYVVIRPVRDGYHSDHDSSSSSSSSSNKCFKEAFKFENLIETLPFMPIVSPLRDEFTAAKQSSSSSSSSSSSFSTIRMCTYNILADLYVSRQLDDGATTYPHVKNYDHIKKNRRIPMIVGELLAYRSDIICLQEVDGSVYDTYLEPVLQSMGYDGYYSNKASSQREGCAMFWLRDMFDLDKAEVFNVSDLFQSDIDNNDIHDSDDEKQNNATTNNIVEDDNNPEKGTNVDPVLSQTRWDSMKDINLLLESHNELRRVVIEKLGQVVQIATLKLKNPIKGQQPNFMIVANTHLFYHPLADHIRAMQVYVVLKKIDEVRRRRHHSCSNNSCLEEEEYSYPFMFCGDLNSDPLSGASQLIYTRSLASDQYDCWKYLYKYQWDWDGSHDEDAMITEHDESKYRNNDTAVGIIERNDETMRQDKIISIPTESKPLSTACTTGRSPLPPFIQLPGSFPILQSGCKEMPKFTNYAPGFVDTLDYVFGSQASKNERFGFQPKRSAPMPSIKDVEPFFAMPNEVMPSDHVSIVCDFEWCRY
ncbi:Exo_endo_phos-domain-containing protein [Fragilariopsis cylindrus CCMP1102]|uniref:Exo_endo_phos-domain-containing protein n=1 Tax=Fragilariopsis cylindrus CCMP1102 TaxID=635003 RepID=A0A1E7F8Y6_9STRA|nr:Exo_endo_phos-domain-containing protein [Fragilariopsis cylindrus CCMP1102]|eukprot:OEU14594.1 Exo_endo_phos-domain-containing protein [Fragilariopsis cylindrus CCMP1102]